jgi:glutamyl-tRNA reductase
MNRSRERAEELAQRYGGKVIGWGEWETALMTPDVVVSSVASEEVVLGREILQGAMAARGNKALFLMDLGVPRNIEASAAELYNTYVYNLDDLTEIVEQNRNAREGEIPRAETIFRGRRAWNWWVWWMHCGGDCARNGRPFFTRGWIR